jgi:hypothetical protein
MTAEKFSTGAFVFTRTRGLEPRDPDELVPLAIQHGIESTFIPTYPGDRVAITHASRGLANEGFLLRPIRRTSTDGRERCPLVDFRSRGTYWNSSYFLDDTVDLPARELAPSWSFRLSWRPRNFGRRLSTKLLRHALDNWSCPVNARLDVPGALVHVITRFVRARGARLSAAVTLPAEDVHL